MRVRLKVCCISSVEEARLAVAAGAAAVGLVGEMPSGPGVIDTGLIAKIATTVPPPVARFLLTSRTELGGVISHIAASRCDTVQLVDAVSDEVYLGLAHVVPQVRVVQVIHVEDERAITEALRVAPFVHAILLDSGRPNAELRELGGTGRTHNWSISRQIVARLPATPVFLAGGINPANVGMAMSTVAPYGLDLCSAVRTDGHLDPVKLAAMVEAIAQAEGVSV